MKEQERAYGKVGVPVAWIAVYAGIIVVAQFIPLFPYVGGGGYVPLSLGFFAMAPLLLGTSGVVAAFVGAAAGLFVIPINYWLGFIDIINFFMPAVIALLLVNCNKYKKITVPIYVAFYITAFVFPYYIPGPPAGFDNPPQPLWTILTGIFYIPWLVVAATPIGTKYLPSWVRSQERRKRYTGILITVLGTLYVYFLFWHVTYAYAFHYPVLLSVACWITYLWYWPILAVIITAICIPIIEALERSGLPSLPLAIWGQQ